MITIQTTCIPSSIVSMQGFIDPNCDSLAFISGGACYLCTAGYVLVEGAGCVPCAGSVGCMVCDPKNSTNCLLCQTGYSMTTQGVCVLNSQASAIVIQASFIQPATGFTHLLQLVAIPLLILAIE
jgi:hypothetical protein